MKMEKELMVKEFKNISDLYEHIKKESDDSKKPCTLEMEEGKFKCDSIEDAFELMVAKMMIELEKEKE